MMRLCQGSSLELSLLCPCVLLKASSQLLSLGDTIAFAAALTAFQPISLARKVLCMTVHFPVKPGELN